MFILYVFVGLIIYKYNLTRFNVISIHNFHIPIFQHYHILTALHYHVLTLSRHHNVTFTFSYYTSPIIALSHYHNLRLSQFCIMTCSYSRIITPRNVNTLSKHYQMICVNMQIVLSFCVCLFKLYRCASNGNCDLGLIVFENI